MPGLPSPGSLQRIVLPGIAAGVVILLNLQSLWTGFSLDDYWLLSETNARELPWAGNWAGESTFYRPLVILSFKGDLAIFGTDAFGFHAINILLHALTCLVLYSLLQEFAQRLSPSGNGLPHASPIAAFILTLLFAVHPANAHNIVWIPGRTDLLAGLFAALALLFFLRSLGPDRWGLKLLGLLSFLFALASKEIAVIVPAVAAVMIFWISHIVGRNWKASLHTSLIALTPYFVLLAIYVTFRLTMIPYSEGTLDWFSLPLRTAAATFIKIFVLYLSPFEPIELFYFFMDSPVLAIMAAACLCTVAAWICARIAGTNPRVLIAGIGALLLATPVFLMPNIMHGWISQRIMYLPLLGIAITGLPLAVYAIKGIGDSKRSLLSAGVVVALTFVLFGAISVRTVSLWNRVSGIEESLAGSILEQHREGVPVIVLTAPARVGQVWVSSSFDYVLGFLVHRQFSRLDSVYVGIHVVAASFDELMAGTDVQVSEKSPGTFTIMTTRPGQFLFPSFIGLRSRHGNAVLDVNEGDLLENDLLLTHVRRTSAAGRAVSIDVTIKDPALAGRSEIYVYQGDRMIRVQ